MTQKEKQLLLKDLCARLPYGINGFITVHKTVSENSTFNSVIDGKLYDRFANLQDSWYDNIPSIKPYLRPMSSLIEKELDECRATCKYRQVGQSVLDCATPETIDYLISHHFDYRGLIEKGLALEAPKGLYEN